MCRGRKWVVVLAGMLVLVCAAAALRPYVTHAQGQGQGPPPKADQRRLFYLTATPVAGGQALTACAMGYHMASLWEIFDTSNLTYDTQLGVTTADSGFGPPSAIFGWIRTGFEASGTASSGRGNCQAWTSSGVQDAGTVVGLPLGWDSTDARRVQPWQAGVESCSGLVRVWCVQD